MIYQLPAQNGIRGDQLADEILQTVGVDVSADYAFVPPDQVEITGFDEHQVAIQAVIDAHVPQAEYFRAEIEAKQLRDQIRTLAQSAVGVTLNDLTAAQQRALLAIVLWQAGAVDSDLTIRPLSEWVR